MIFRTVIDRWENWVATGRLARTLADWSGHYPHLSDWDTIELRSPECSPATDAMQATLVALAQTGDELAAATIIVQLRPGLAALARRALHYGGPWTSLADITDEVESSFGEVLMTHSLQRRPRHIAANLLLDTRQRLWRSSRRHPSPAAAVACPADETQETPHAPASDHLPEDQADTLDLMGDMAQALGELRATEDSRLLTAEVAYRAWFLDQSPAQIAHSVGLRPNAVSTRLCRLRQQVRRVHLTSAVAI